MLPAFLSSKQPFNTVWLLVKVEKINNVFVEGLVNVTKGHWAINPNHINNT